MVGQNEPLWTAAGLAALRMMAAFLPGVEPGERGQTKCFGTDCEPRSISIPKAVMRLSAFTAVQRIPHPLDAVSIESVWQS